jgi:nucleoside 2-deoxyribosyltransferase
LLEKLSTLANHLQLHLPSVSHQYYGQARWDALRSCHAGVFDLRGCRPRLAHTDPAAASALAATAYELGLALALGRPVVITIRPDDALPFDIDVAPCVLRDDAGDEPRLAEALDAAWYGRQRTTSQSSLPATYAFLDQTTRDHPRRHTLEACGLLNPDNVDDAVGFAGSIKQVLREEGLSEWQVICPSWAGSYPEPESPSLFHVMPFSESWSDEIRNAARAVCTARQFAYRRGDEAEEGRIIQAIWDDLCRAHLVLADLTGLNLNVMIELGMAHALGRTTLAVRRTATGEPLPRNIEKLRVLEYADASGLRRLLESRLSPGQTR